MAFLGFASAVVAFFLVVVLAVVVVPAFVANDFKEHDSAKREESQAKPFCSTAVRVASRETTDDVATDVGVSRRTAARPMDVSIVANE